MGKSHGWYECDGHWRKAIRGGTLCEEADQSARPPADVIDKKDAQQSPLRLPDISEKPP